MGKYYCPDSTIKHLRLAIKPWKEHSLKYYNKRCVITNKKSGLTVHHHEKNFYDIVREACRVLDLPYYEKMSSYDYIDFSKLSSKVLEMHYDLGYGIPIHYKLHKKFHQIYGYTNNTKEQFKEFKKHYKHIKHKAS